MAALAARVRAIPTWQVTLGVALLVLGFLIAAQLASEGPRIRITSQERTPLVATALDLQAQQDDLKERVLDLRAEHRRPRGGGAGRHDGDPGTSTTGSRRRGWPPGLVAMTGPGLVIQLADSSVAVPQGSDESDYLVSGQDVRAVVDELWLAGAEGVAVNGERVTVATAIVDIGGSVLVNSAYVAPPYQVSAIGAPDMLDRLTASPGFVDFIRARAETFGIGVDYATPPDGRPARLRRLGEPPLRPADRDRRASPAPSVRHGAP